MSREIKFRAWYKPLSIMIESGALESINFETKVVGAYIEFDDRGYHKLRLSDFELMQYTGIHDCNGKEIFEGDFVTLTKRDEEYVIQGNGYMDVGIENGWSVSGTVKFLHNSWFIEEDNEKGLPLDFEGEQALEIIGNIHENPELLQSV